MIKDYPIGKICIYSFISQYKDIHGFYVEKEDESEAKELLDKYIQNHREIKNFDDFDNLRKFLCDNGIKNYVWMIDKPKMHINFEGFRSSINHFGNVLDL